MHWSRAVLLIAALAQAVLADSETYTLLHRAQKVLDSGMQTYSAWQPRALIRVPTTAGGGDGLPLQEGITTETNFPDPDTDTYYQLLAVKGDARSFSHDEWQKKVADFDGFLAFVKLVRILAHSVSTAHGCRCAARGFCAAAPVKAPARARRGGHAAACRRPVVRDPAAGPVRRQCVPGVWHWRCDAPFRHLFDVGRDHGARDAPGVRPFSDAAPSAWPKSRSTRRPKKARPRPRPKRPTSPLTRSRSFASTGCISSRSSS